MHQAYWPETRKIGAFAVSDVSLVRQNCLLIPLAVSVAASSTHVTGAPFVACLGVLHTDRVSQRR